MPALLAGTSEYSWREGRKVETRLPSLITTISFLPSFSRSFAFGELEAINVTWMYSE